MPKKIYFPQPDARLPVRLRDGHVTRITGSGKLYYTILHKLYQSNEV